MNLIGGEYDRQIIGVLSNSQKRYEYSYFIKMMKSNIEEDIRVIYICYNLKDVEAIRSHIKNNGGKKHDNIIETQQFKILIKEEYEYEYEYEELDDSIVDKFIEDILIEIRALDDKLFKRTHIYLNIDKGINKMSKELLDRSLRLFENIAKEHDMRLILRFFMDEITNFCFFSLLSESGYFIVEDMAQGDFVLNHDSKIVTSSKSSLDSTIEGIQQEYEVNNMQSFNQITDEVSHDLKNVFATISGYSQLAMLRTESTEVKDYLKIILNNCLDIHSIFERFHNHTPDLNIKDGIYSFNNLVMDSSEMAFNMKRNKLSLDNSKVSISYSLNSQKDVCCDKNQIKQVIMNIIDNGIHALNGEGTIIINTYDDKATAVLEIIDNGTGIDEDTQVEIFKPYFTTKGDLGMGLGLNIAKRTLKSHGATISVESRLGVGTKFIITFPATHKELNIHSKDISI